MSENINKVDGKFDFLAEYKRIEAEEVEKRDQEILSKTDYTPLAKSIDLKKDGWHLVGYVDVDVGLVMVGDPCYASVENKDDPTKRHPIHDWSKFTNSLFEYPRSIEPVAKSLKHSLGHTGAGVVVSSGEGDGSYGVYVRYHLDMGWGRPIRRISEMRVVFMREWEDEDDGEEE